LNAVLFWFNLLPIPPLDGGQAVYRLFAGRKWVEKVYPYVRGFGLAVLFALTEIAILKDVARLLGR
jgi:Zn-dependent protease